MTDCVVLYNYEIGVSFTPTGTFTVLAGSKEVDGVGTSFTTQFQVGYLVRIGSQWRVVEAIADNTNMTVTANFSAPETGVAALGVNLLNVERLTTPLPAPKGEYEPWAESQKLASGGARGLGSPRGRWRWGFVSQAMRNQLRTFCTGKSNAVYVRTRINDSSDAYGYFTAQVIWPDGTENKDNGRRINFTLELESLEAITVS